MTLQLGRAEREGSVSQRLVAEPLLKINAIKVDLNDAEKADPRKCLSNAVGGPKFSHARPAHGEEEHPGEGPIDKVALPMVHEQYQVKEERRRR